MEGKRKMIFYFSGTGNSLYVAKKLSESLMEPGVFSMADKPPAEQLGSPNGRIGFVFPSYYGNLPRIAQRFICDLIIHPDTYVFAVVTMGGGFGQASIAALERVLAEKGIRLCYGRGILMPANYIAKYNPMFIGRAAKADRRISRVSGEIKAQKPKIKRFPMSADSLYKDIESLDEKFFTEPTCDGCGLCEKICPAGNITLADRRPEWRRHCEHCMACINWCPREAIQYGAKTKKRGRYHNPYVTAKDMLAYRRRDHDRKTLSDSNS
jgi:ferredoxin